MNVSYKVTVLEEKIRWYSLIGLNIQIASEVSISPKIYLTAPYLE